MVATKPYVAMEPEMWPVRHDFYSNSPELEATRGRCHSTGAAITALTVNAKVLGVCLLADASRGPWGVTSLSSRGRRD